MTWLSATAILGLAALAAGSLLYLVCIWDFAVQGGFAPRELVARGMYRFVRNPMYLALILVLLGETVLFRSRRLLGYGLGIWLALHALVVLYEERGLARAFGAGFTRYRERVPRWLPRLHPPAP